MKKLKVFDNYKTPSDWKERAMNMEFNKKEKEIKVTRPGWKIAVVFAAAVVIGAGTVGYGLLGNNDNDLDKTTQEKNCSVADNISKGKSVKNSSAKALKEYPVTAKVISVKGNEVKANWFGKEITLDMSNAKYVNKNYNSSMLEEGDMISFDYKKNGDVYQPQTVLADFRKPVMVSSTVNRIEGNKIYFQLFGKERFITSDNLSFYEKVISEEGDSVEKIKYNQIKAGNIVEFMTVTSIFDLQGDNKEIASVTSLNMAKMDSNEENRAVAVGALTEENIYGENVDRFICLAATVKKIENNIITVNIGGEDYTVDLKKTTLEDSEKLNIKAGQEITLRLLYAQKAVKNNELTQAGTVDISAVNEFKENNKYKGCDAVVAYYQGIQGDKVIAKCGELKLALDVSGADICDSQNVAYSGTAKKVAEMKSFKKGEELCLMCEFPEVKKLADESGERPVELKVKRMASTNIKQQ